MTVKLTNFHLHIDEDDKVSVSAGFTASSVDEAKDVLSKLSPGWNLSGKGSQHDDDPPAAAPPKPAAAPAKPAKPSKPKPKPEPEPEPEVEETEEEEEETEEAEEEEETEEAEVEEEPAPKGKLKITAEDVRALKEAKKLRDVLDFLVSKKNVRTKAGLLAACKALKSSVPVLGRIEDLDTRLPQSIELMDPTIK